MNSLGLKQFQDQVSELVLRHRSILDVLSKCNQSNSSVHRSVIKSITECGCVEVHASKQPYTSDMTLEQAKESLQTHMEGQLCDNCMEAVSSELGKSMFYMSALCNMLNIDLEDVITKESSRCSTLGLFRLS